jgi:hypothetical protein
MKIMKTLEQIQEFNRRKIICAVNGTEDYAEALKIEKNKNAGAISFCKNCKEFISIGNSLDGFVEFRGNEIKLDRVLLALELYPNNFGIIAGNIARIDRKNHTYNFICSWDLTKPTLEEQSEETQRAIYTLLGGKND